MKRRNKGIKDFWIVEMLDQQSESSFYYWRKEATETELRPLKIDFYLVEQQIYRCLC